tara:strand:+ start:4683 stop:5420 length:738 start_codon:yes stop_codon:yes gene_type:complete
MYFNKGYYSSDKENIFYLAPIPLYIKQYDDELSDTLFSLGKEVLSEGQQKMGQELPEKYDDERYNYYNINYDRKENWVESDSQMPIGSRFFTPPNDFLNRTEDCVLDVVDRIKVGFKELINSLDFDITVNESVITESWLQYYKPTSGLGHNQHNHSRWSKDEQTNLSFSGGYYLSDGEPLPDHPYSGVFAFHERDRQYMIRPKKGMLIIWPSDIVHSVKPFYGKSERAVINFNLYASKVSKNKLL